MTVGTKQPDFSCATVSLTFTDKIENGIFVQFKHTVYVCMST